MGVRIAVGVLLLLASLEISQGNVTFDRRFTYQEVDESKLAAATAADLVDTKNTGTKLFDSSTVGKDKKLASYVYIKDFKSKKSKYYRAHPVFTKCIDKIFSKLDNSDAGHRLLVGSAFKTKSEAGNSEHDQYACAGTAAVLIYRQDSRVKSVLDIAKEALKQCPAIFASIQRDLGVVLLADGVGIHMRGPLDKQPYYASDGGEKSSADFKKWCLDQIDERFETGPKPTDCAATGLNSGEAYPNSAKNPEEVVGRLDVPVTRKDVEDFKRLLQFDGRVIEFENSESSSSWCGFAGNPCRPCSDGIYGSALDDRCADRVVSPRMYSALNKLQFLVRKGMNDKLVVTEAWDEAHSGALTGDNPAKSLHYEGRQVEAKLKNGGSLTTLTKYAICAGIDYVKNNGASVTFAVRKQETLEDRKVRFDGNNELLIVALPARHQHRYKLDPSLDPETMPLFYADFQDSTPIADDHDVTVGMFRSGETCIGSPDCPEEDDDYRYFRLNPGIVKCFSLIKDKVTREFNKTLAVDQAYQSTEEWINTVDVYLDPRGWATAFGDAMQINFPGFCPYRLAEIAVDQCAKIAQSDDEQALGIGLYEDFLYVDIRYNFSVWVENPALLPKDCVNTDKFESRLALRFGQTVLGQRIDPDDLDVACGNADPPKPQSANYTHEHSPAIKAQKRARRDATIDGECQPQTDTAFCKDTKKHRDAVVTDIWEEITRKAHDKDMIDIKKALEGCFGACGTCLEGVVWEDKIENCQNLIHWIAFHPLNDGQESHFYSSDNMAARRHAYAPYTGRHCVDRSALYGLFADPVKKLYRPDPTKSIEEQLYSPENNPSPLMDLIKRMYAFNAEGKAVLWINDDTEATSMKNVLRMLMVYNKKLTGIDVMVPDEISAETVGAVIENSIAEWTKSTCTKYSREYITPFRIITGWPQSRKRRDADGNEEIDFGEGFLMDRLNFETNWIENHP
ncbi:uncharacterized protein LOC135490616 [Lineus longissimus]|uniref:uncharacterized protein LOC135490616 n=1 Tax=Lineus longissimus TaxID=88925 RepID=UPI002B4C2EED